MAFISTGRGSSGTRVGWMKSGLSGIRTLPPMEISPDSFPIFKGECSSNYSREYIIVSAREKHVMINTISILNIKNICLKY